MRIPLTLRHDTPPWLMMLASFIRHTLAIILRLSLCRRCSVAVLRAIFDIMRC